MVKASLKDHPWYGHTTSNINECLWARHHEDRAGGFLNYFYKFYKFRSS